MKRLLLTLIFASLYFAIDAQVQYGVVKTRGRVQEDGSYKPGYRVPEVLVSIKGGNDYICDAAGEFSFNVPNSGNYSISKVVKKGYQLSDFDLLLHQRKYTETPVYILLENNEEVQRYRRVIERKIRTNYQNQIYAMQAELDQLKTIGKVSKEELIQKQRIIDEKWNWAEQYVKDLSEKYLLIDYDQDDAFSHKVGYLILSGEFKLADSLLNTKGNLYNRVIKGISTQNAIDNYNEETARMCDYKHNIFLQLNKLDSAAHYLNLKASLTPENIDWQLDAARFQAFYLKDHKGGLEIAQNALNLCLNDKRFHDNLSLIYCCKGEIYQDLFDYEEGMKCYEDAMRQFLLQNHYTKELETFETKGYVPANRNWWKNKPGLIPIYLGMANCLAELHMRGKGYNNKYIGAFGLNYAFDLYCFAIKIGEEIYGGNHYKTGNACYEFASWLNSVQSFRSAGKVCERTIDIFKSLSDNTHSLAASYLLLGDIYRGKGKSKLAIEYVHMAIDLYSASEDAFSKQGVCSAYGLLGLIYSDKKEYVKAIDNYLKAESVGLSIYGDYNIKMATLYNNIGYTYGMMDNKPKALLYLNKSYDIRLSFLGAENRYTRLSKENIEYIIGHLN